MTLKNKQDYSRQKARQLVKLIDKYTDLPSSQFVHHLDCDPFNNELNNLTIISNSEHTELHWILNPHRENMGRKLKSAEEYLKELEDLLILYNFNPL